MVVTKIENDPDQMAEHLGISQGEWLLNLGQGIQIAIEKDAAGLAISIAKQEPKTKETFILHHKFIPQSELKVEPLGYFEGKPIYSKDELPDEVKARLDDLLTAKI